jgi:hypothetical protein
MVSDSIIRIQIIVLHSPSGTLMGRNEFDVTVVVVIYGGVLSS